MYQHLQLARWPFRVVPEPSECTFIADRQQLRNDLDDLLDGFARRDTSSIHLFWAWFGAGKTHSLYYLAHRIRGLGVGLTSGSAVYSEFPKAPQNFVDVYRAFVAGLDGEALVDAFLELSTAGAADRILRDLMLASPDLVTALHVYATGDLQDQLLAMRWLRAERLPLSEYRQVGLSKAVNSTEEASATLAGIVAVLHAAARSRGYTGAVVAWLLDEVQRISQSPPRIRADINAGLHSTFNACPTGLGLVLSFSGHPGQNLPGWFSPELKDRIGRTRVMVLPPLTPTDGLTFVRDVLSEARGNQAPADAFFPFTQEACEAIIAEVDQQDELKPRALMQAFDAVLNHAEHPLADGAIQRIDPEFARGALQEYVGFGGDVEE